MSNQTTPKLSRPRCGSCGRFMAKGKFHASCVSKRIELESEETYARPTRTPGHLANAEMSASYYLCKTAALVALVIALIASSGLACH